MISEVVSPQDLIIPDQITSVQQHVLQEKHIAFICWIIWLSCLCLLGTWVWCVRVWSDIGCSLSKDKEFLNFLPRWKWGTPVIGLSINQSRDLLHAGYSNAFKENSGFTISWKGANTDPHLTPYQSMLIIQIIVLFLPRNSSVWFTLIFLLEGGIVG